MKKCFLAISLSLLTLVGFSQSLSQVSLTGATTLASYSFITSENVIIRLTPDGSIIDWGTELEPGRMGYYEGKLLPYAGRVSYYGEEADEAYRGKVRSIGSANITYYGASMPAEQKGKVKSIGSQQFDYYMNYDNESFRGKLKTAGNTSFTYFGSYDNESFRGKLKSAGNTSITYYSVFDDKLNKGKIKSIGSVSFSWYNEFDKKELQGAMKTGSTMQKINGVVYKVW
ncbi:hypothetical protein [Ferruginibacter sp.]